MFECEPFDNFVPARLVDAFDDTRRIMLHEESDAALGLDAQGSTPIVSSARKLDWERVPRVFFADYLAPTQQKLLLGDAFASEGFACDDRQECRNVLGEFMSPLGILHGREYSIGYERLNTTESVVVLAATLAEMVRCARSRSAVALP